LLLVTKIAPSIVQVGAIVQAVGPSTVGEAQLREAEFKELGRTEEEIRRE
jgi:hypothetical protein